MMIRKATLFETFECMLIACQGLKGDKFHFNIIKELAFYPFFILFGEMYVYDDAGIKAILMIEGNKAGHLFVKKEHRHWGIGTKMYQFALTKIKQKHSCMRIKSTEQNLRYYWTKGFHIVGSFRMVKYFET